MKKHGSLSQYSLDELFLQAKLLTLDIFDNFVRDDQTLNKDSFNTELIPYIANKPHEIKEQIAFNELFAQFTQIFADILLHTQNRDALNKVDLPVRELYLAGIQIHRLRNTLAIDKLVATLKNWIQDLGEKNFLENSGYTELPNLASAVMRCLMIRSNTAALYTAKLFVKRILSGNSNYLKNQEIWLDFYDAAMHTQDNDLRSLRLFSRPIPIEMDITWKNIALIEDSSFQKNTYFENFLLLGKGSLNIPLAEQLFTNSASVTDAVNEFHRFCEDIANLLYCIQITLVTDICPEIAGELRSIYLERNIITEEIDFIHWLHAQNSIEELLLDYINGNFSQIYKKRFIPQTQTQICLAALLESLAASALGQPKRASDILALPPRMNPNHGFSLPLETLYHAQRAQFAGSQTQHIIEEIQETFVTGNESALLAVIIADAYVEEKNFLDAQNWITIAEQLDDNTPISHIITETKYKIATRALNATDHLPFDIAHPLIELAYNLGNSTTQIQATLALISHPVACLELLKKTNIAFLEDFSLACLELSHLANPDNIIEIARVLEDDYPNDIFPLTLLGYAFKSLDYTRATEYLMEGIYNRSSGSQKIKKNHLRLLINVYLAHQDFGAAANALGCAYQVWNDDSFFPEIIAHFFKAGSAQAQQAFRQVTLTLLDPESCKKLLEQITQKRQSPIEPSNTNHLEDELYNELISIYPHILHYSFILLPPLSQLIHIATLLLQPPPEKRVTQSPFLRVPTHLI